MKNDIYKDCPIYTTENLTLRLTSLIANQDFYKAFEVDSILTKAIQSANERIASLQSKGYVPINKKFMVYDDYFIRTNVTN